MSKILATYDSKSNPGREYHIMEPMNGGNPYCTCWQWKKTRDCKHLRQYHGIIKTKPTVTRPKEMSFDDDIEAAVQNIINS